MFAVIGNTIRARWRLWLLTAVGIVIAYYVAQFLILELRFGHLPNYITLYNYPSNVARIVHATPSFTDMVPIILDEWLLEVGYMNYDFGHGIAEWSLAILPAKLVVVALLAAMVSTDFLLWHGARAACSPIQRPTVVGVTGIGAVMLGFANVSLTWVVCCATPSWVVSLTLLGFGSATSLALEPYGIWIALAGIALLVGATLWLARRRRLVLSIYLGTVVERAA
jgi:hypothetical protein